MPTPERAARPQPRPTPSALSMRDLLASCAAATAVSTPPSDAPEEASAGDARGAVPPPARRDAA
ncbi:hypothetical protein [Streptomyces sp. TRM75563]|uniref:hypothetical protein n=1 Tax=Streptomyces sp. TRM75563 TaxID=2817418 RepID=UPI001F620C4F|nr:hypothetical protein [Streptomyces sp. TRM75563]MCI4044518.1 hypothetical protein [Streptomyces sp. TRM75563]